MPKLKRRPQQGGGTVASRTNGFREAGELLSVEAIDRTGLVVTSEGALVHILHVIPPNPLLMADHDRQEMASAFCDLASRLRSGQSLQFYVEARPMDLERLLAAS